MDSAVIVVGAGPAGLMLAGELCLADVPVIVLERLDEPTGESRGLGFTGRTMEVFDQRGLLSRLGPIETSNVGHFGGLSMDFGVLEGAAFGGKGVPQGRTEAMLEEWATDVGADIRRGWNVLALTDDGTGVEVEVSTPDGPARLRADYVVGCDGGRSTVRKVAGFDFPGTAATMEMFIADVTDCDIEPRWAGELRPNGMVMAGPLGDGVTRIVVCERGRAPQRRAAAPDFAEVADGWRRLTGQDISHGTALWASAFGDATRQVTTYRRGRVLLAGDAAHIHLPAGGQGMNTSIQDVVNLGWKLAAVVNGWAPEGLLDTYDAERRPVGKRLLMNTQAQGLLFLGGDEVQPLRDVMTELMAYDDVRRHLVGMVSGLEIHYDMGSGDHPLLGYRVPHLKLTGAAAGTNVAELLHSGRGLVLDLGDDAALRRTTAPWADRVDTVTASFDGDADAVTAKAEALLVRPDGYVAWAAPGCTDLESALEKWFGAPKGED